MVSPSLLVSPSFLVSASLEVPFPGPLTVADWTKAGREMYWNSRPAAGRTGAFPLQLPVRGQSVQVEVLVVVVVVVVVL